MERGLYKKHSNLHTTATALVLIIFTVLTDHIQAAGVDVEPNTALLMEGQKTELLCRYGGPIIYCRIEIPGEKVLNLSPEWSNTPGFSYFGSGLQAGQCGVTIDRVSASHNGKVKCSLGVQGGEQENHIDLVVALRPQQPVIEVTSKGVDRDESFAAESKFEARCIVRDGRPAANITWFIDDAPIMQGLSRPEVIESQNDRNVTLSTTVQLLQRYLTPEDDGKMLICRAYHQTDRDQPQEGKLLLKVKYAPVPQPESTVYGLYLEHTAMVNVTIRANPAPITEWTIEGTAIPQGTQSGRYSAYEPQSLGNGYYNATLAIAGLTLQDTTKTYSLKASNAFGVRDYTVRISSSLTPPSSGLDVGSIVGIAVAVAILVIIVLLIGFARATGRWCFGAKSSRSPTSETHDGTQQPGPNVALLESNTNNNATTPNGVTVVSSNNGNKNTNATANSNGNQNNMNGRHRNNSIRASMGTVNGNDDDSFEYATDRESGVYNATTIPFKGGRNSTSSRQSTATTASDELDPHQGVDLLTRGNQLGIPESRCTRWIPKDQRELLESSDTESADIKTETKLHAAKSKRLPSFSSLFMRRNEKSKKDSTLATDQPATNNTTTTTENGEDLGESNRAMTASTGEVGVRTLEGSTTTTTTTAGNDNAPKEDKQLVYAELVLKPSDNQPIPSKNSTEYAEIVYVQKPTPAENTEAKGKK